MNIRQILQLKDRGESNRSVSHLTGIHRNTVNDYVRQFERTGHDYKTLQEWSDNALSDLFPERDSKDTNRYETLRNYFPYFQKELKKVGCTRNTFWKEYIAKHPDGYRLSQFNDYLRKWLKRVNGSGKLEHKAGDKLYVDYTGKKL